MYRIHLASGANQGENPGIGESPSNQPISGLVIFSKRQALSRAVVVNSNMSRGKYLAREGPGSRLGRILLAKVTHAQYRKRFRVSYNTSLATGMVVLATYIYVPWQ